MRNPGVPHIIAEAFAYAVSLIQAGYTVDEAGDAASIQHGLDEYQEDDMNRRLRRFFAD